MNCDPTQVHTNQSMNNNPIKTLKTKNKVSHKVNRIYKSFNRTKFVLVKKKKNYYKDTQTKTNN